jgi:hypothetical protein
MFFEKICNKLNRIDLQAYHNLKSKYFICSDYTHCRPQEDLAPSKCFKFQMPSDVDFNDVKSAHLWIFKRLSQEDSKNNQTFVIQEINHWDKEKSFKKRNTLAIQSTSNGQGNNVNIFFEKFRDDPRKISFVQMAG